jgi:mono/diheme cytochrome c family protein
VKNPVAVSDEVLGRGAQLFKKNCLMCHGEKGKGDGPATTYIKPAPADITPVERQESWTDGEIFWKITTGKNPMPSYGKKLSEEERWMIVHFTRTLKGQ